MRAAASPWLRAIYPAALVLHAVFVTGMLWLNIAAAGGMGNTANAARESVGLSLILIVTGMLITIPSIIALLSWALCRRRGWTPSAGHMGLTVAAAALVAAFGLYVVVSA